jgi:GntR family transcriptional repressor for pyruvate dehydrogenase complex
LNQGSLKIINTDKIHTQIYEQLRKLLLEGHWKAGEKIPSENELCRLMGVSRISVRTAIKSLIAQGFLVSRQGEGTFVVDVSIDLNMNVLIPIIGLDDKNILEVLEYRKIIEVGIIPLFFKNLSDAGIQALRENVEELESTPENEIKRVTQLDLGFHRLICQISGNSLIIKVSQILNELFRKSMEEAVINLGNLTGRKYHRRIFEAILSGNQEKTKEILLEHIQETQDSIEHLHIKDLE